MLEALIVAALLVASCTGEIMENSSSKKTELPRLRLNSVGESSGMSNSHSPENKREKGRKRRIQKPKNPQKNEREKKRVEAVATAYKQLQTGLGLGAGDENRKRTTKVETLQAAVKLIHNLTEELAGLQLL